ncbi:ExbD/TolR family protein, partial [Undibacterium oligocarboniphilum]
MGMQVGGGSATEPEVMIEMNMTPLIDVMLVLIIMLIITIPIQNHAVNLNMPTNTPSKPTEPPVVINIDVDFDGTVLWNGAAVANRNELEAKLTEIAAQPNQPEVHLRPNAVVPYKS